MNYEKQLSKLRKAMKETQSEFAKAIGVSEIDIKLFESGKKKIPIKRMATKIAKHCGLTLTMFTALGAEQKDSPKGKRDLFDQLKPAIDGLIIELVKEHRKKNLKSDVKDFIQGKLK